MISKIVPAFKKAFFPLCITAVGAFLIATPYNPGAFSNIMAWLETDGGGVSLCIGSLLFLIGISSLFLSLRLVFRRLHIVHGKLSCFVEENVIQGIVEQILTEYFGTKDLQVKIALSKNNLSLDVEIPESDIDIDDFTGYVQDRLFLLVGYYGKIFITTHPKKMFSAFQEPA